MRKIIILIVTLILICGVGVYRYYYEYDAEYAMQATMKFARKQEPDVDFSEDMFYIVPNFQSDDYWEVNIELPPESYEYKYRTEYVNIDKKTGKVIYSGYHDTAERLKYKAFAEAGIIKNRWLLGPERIIYDE